LARNGDPLRAFCYAGDMNDSPDQHFVLVSARKSHGADFWNKDDYDVRLGDRSGPVVGRIIRHPSAPEGQPWFWTITAREQPPSVYNRGYATSREQAMADFKARWLATPRPSFR
jgi:hypothetical protein